MLLVQRTTVQPRWHSWRQAAAVLDVDEQAGFATLKNYKGRNSRVSGDAGRRATYVATQQYSG